MTTTVRDVANRLLRTMLTPPDRQPIQVSVAVPVDPFTSDLILGDFMVSEDATLMRQGAILELDEELVRVMTFDAVTMTASVERGIYSTERVRHNLPLLATMNPSFPMQSIFEAIRDNIAQLYPRLSTIATTTPTDPTNRDWIDGWYVWMLDDPRAVSVVETYMFGHDAPVDMEARIVNINGVPMLATSRRVDGLELRYRRNMGIADSLDDTLYSLGVYDEWANVVVVGAAADLLAGRDIPKAQSDWIGKSLEAENVKVGTRAQLSVGLARYRELLIDRLSRAQKGQETNSVKVHFSDPWAQVR